VRDPRNTVSRLAFEDDNLRAACVGGASPGLRQRKEAAKEAGHWPKAVATAVRSFLYHS